MDESIRKFDISDKDSLKKIKKNKTLSKNLDKKKVKEIECYLCGRLFHPANRYKRFCQECRDENELFQTYF